VGLGLLAAGLAVGCGKSSPCTTTASPQQICSSCPSSWTAVEQDHDYCTPNGASVIVAGTCGRYHALVFGGVDASVTYFYDARTGALVAASSWNNGTQSCMATPASEFVMPDCDTSGFTQLPGWCCGDDAGASMCTDAGSDGG
jgi:hypothetical protein